MDIHKNARLTFRSREALVEIVHGGMRCRHAAAVFRVTPKTAAKWVHRFQSQGRAGLLDRSSRPRRTPRATSSRLATQVIELRRQYRPAYQIAQATALSPATVSRILRRAHLNRWRDLHPAPPVVRYEHPFPGDLLHLDIKGMTRYQQVSIPGDGRRRGRPQFAGWEALHIAIDDHSRLAFSRLLPNQRTETPIAFLHDALAFYAQHGIRIRRLLTDNRSCYRSRQFRRACAQLGIRHRFTRPYTPRTNGKAERFIQTALREWAYVRHWPNSEERDQSLLPWLQHYNFIRPHASLDLRSSYQPHPFRWYNVLINYSYPILAAPFAAGGDFDPLVLSAARTSQHPALSLQRTQRQEPALSAAEGRGHPFSDMAFGARKNGNLRLST